MESLKFNDREYLHAFIKTAQFLATMTTHEDAWRNLARVMVKFFGADSSGFARLSEGGQVEFHHITGAVGRREVLTCDEVKETAHEVLETGFLAWRAISAAQPYMVVCLLVSGGDSAPTVLLVGHATSEPVSREMLNVYLAVAGLAGATITRLTSEMELKKNRAHLEELVAARTAELKQTLGCLEVEFAGHMKAEEELRKYRDHLEELVQERTVELGHAVQELRVYSGKLERMNRELQEFAFIASHDLQEPLRKIQTFGDRLRLKFRERIGADGMDYLNRMIGSAARMSDLLKSLREYSREASTRDPFVRVELAEVVKDAVSDLELLVEKGGACIEIGDLPAIEADPAQMRALFQNLIGNSLKYSRQCEKPAIKVHGRINGGACTVFVEDNGLGFEETYLDRIFRPFQRLHARDAFEGTGMGLFICRKIMERHSGTITAKSVPGRGSTFVLTLPVVQSGEREAEPGPERRVSY